MKYQSLFILIKESTYILYFSALVAFLSLSSTIDLRNSENLRCSISSSQSSSSPNLGQDDTFSSYELAKVSAISLSHSSSSSSGGQRTLYVDVNKSSFKLSASSISSILSSSSSSSHELANVPLSHSSSSSSSGHLAHVD